MGGSLCQVVGPRLQFGLHVICCQDDNDRPTPVPHVYYGDIDSQMAAYWSRAASADKSTTTSDSPGHAGAETVLLETRSGEEVPGATAQSPLQHTSGGMSASPRPRVSVKSLTSSSNISGSVSNGMNTGRKDAALRRWLLGLLHGLTPTADVSVPAREGDVCRFPDANPFAEYRPGNLRLLQRELNHGGAMVVGSGYPDELFYLRTDGINWRWARVKAVCFGRGGWWGTG